MPLLEFDQKFPGILIDSGSPGFFAPTVDALRTVAQLKLGAELLDIISKRCRGIGSGGANPRADLFKCVVRRGPGTVVSTREENTQAYGALDPDTPLLDDLSNYGDVAQFNDWTNRRRRGVTLSLPGNFTSAVATWEPQGNYTAFLAAIGMNVPMPGWLCLAHELIHCMHFLSGDTNRYDDADPYGPGDTWTKHEEARTIGLGIYAKTRISENALRREAGLALRSYYCSPGDCDKLNSATQA